MTRFVTFTGFLTADDPGIWGGGNVPMPTPPIHLPPGIWGGAGSLPPSVMPPIAYPPSIWPNPPGGGGGGSVMPPIYYPPHIWGGAGSLPPSVMPPIAPGGGGPIVLPPLFPTNPIVIPMPPPQGGDGPELGPGDKFIVYYNPKYGWTIAKIEAPGEGGSAPTPAPKPK